MILPWLKDAELQKKLVLLYFLALLTDNVFYSTTYYEYEQDILKSRVR